MAIDAQQLTVIGLLLTIGAAGLARKWVFGWTYTEATEDRDFWRDTAIRLMTNVDKAIDVAAKRG